MNATKDEGCHGPQQRAIQMIVGLNRRVDVRQMDGPVEPGHDT